MNQVYPEDPRNLPAVVREDALIIGGALATKQGRKALARLRSKLLEPLSCFEEGRVLPRDESMLRDGQKLTVIMLEELVALYDKMGGRSAAKE